ncbi:MAG: DNA replication complex GINS family protein [Nanoarchaeota archaeon]|nr:DNA replication complex GINS family protein [Nanoarchaeota archaeon]
MGDEINITFETLYDLLRREKGKEELQQLEETFFKEVVQYLQEKNKLLESKTGDDDLFSVGEKDKLEAELRNIKRILKELYDKREKKVIDMALNRSRTGSNIIDTSALLFEEKKIYEQLVEVFDSFRGSILFNIFKGQMPVLPIKKPTPQAEAPEKPPEIPQDAIKIKIISPVPKFINPIDGGFLGPFELGSEVMLQKPLAELLVEKKRAEFLP